MMPLRALAAALGGDVSGRSVLAPGPGHSKHDRSLSVTPCATAPNGFLVNSFAGDDPIACKDYVLAKLDLPVLRFKPNGHGEEKRRFVNTVTYTYCNQSGEHVYSKERREYDDGSKGFLIKPKGRNGSAPLLYGADRLADISAGHPVWIVEGEKKVDRLRELGAAGVSLDAGANSEWLPEHAKVLRGLRVILWPDSDALGEGYVARAAAEIRTEDPHADVRIVRPFGLPNGEKGRDVCDWKGDRDALARLAEMASVYESGQTNSHAAAAESETQFSEDRLGMAFTERHAQDLRYIAPWGKWFQWSGTHWRHETTLLAFDLARKICRQAAAQCNKPSEAKNIARAKTVAAVEQL